MDLLKTVMPLETRFLGVQCTKPSCQSYRNPTPSPPPRNREGENLEALPALQHPTP